MNNINNTSVFNSNLIAHVFRLHPGQDLYQEIKKYIEKNMIKAACILTCVGSLKKINIRLANAKEFLQLNENFEITSLVGNISCNDRIHLHISISDSKGKTYGGHLCEKDNIVHTTAEIVLGEMPLLNFEKEKDEISGWNELKIEKNKEK